ncbi:MAG TPA: AAA family ATPase, partial [Pyrinomonadaceae bacterium]
MVIYLQGEVDDAIGLDEMTPRQIVAALDKHVVGQAAAKRAVAIALRNRVRRQKLQPEMAADVMPKNIIMIGSTGVGKTEIARRLARMSNSPFLKVEASKFTEVGYVGRDVESMIRDLCEIAVEMMREEKIEEIADKAELNVEERILDLLLPPPKTSLSTGFFDFDEEETEAEQETSESARVENDQFQRTREKLRAQLRAGKLDNRIVEIEIR